MRGRNHVVKFWKNSYQIYLIVKVTHRNLTTIVVQMTTVLWVRKVNATVEKKMMIMLLQLATVFVGDQGESSPLHK